MANWQKSGGYVYLVTLTNRHHKGDDLGDLLQRATKALTKLWEKTAVKKRWLRLWAIMGALPQQKLPMVIMAGTHIFIF